MPYGTVNADLMTTSDGVSSSGLYGFKNRIINGAMAIDQRNAGASVTITNANNDTYTLDRYSIYVSQASKLSCQQNAGSVTPPIGFTNYLGITSLSSYSITSSDWFTIRPAIEGFNTADLVWGTASAKTITLSFQVYSSLTGTFGGSLRNSAGNRSYPFTYFIPIANTWTTISITIAGDTSGTWVGAANGTGITVFWGLGVGSSNSGTAGSWASAGYGSATGATSVVGTNGATFYITGVQLEKGSTATSFDYRPYGTELQLAQRYYYRVSAGGNNIAFGFGQNDSTSNSRGVVVFPVQIRTAPTSLEQSGTASDYGIEASTGGGVCSSVPAFLSSSVVSSKVVFVKATSQTAGQACLIQSGPSTGASAYLGWSAEL
jgi:hypothetical protein